jgi:hypothetical protein
MCKHVVGVVESAASGCSSDQGFRLLVAMPGFARVLSLLSIWREREADVEIARKAERAAKTALERTLAGHEK